MIRAARVIPSQSPTGTGDMARQTCVEIISELRELLGLTLWDIPIYLTDLPGSGGLRKPAVVEVRWEYQLVLLTLDRSFVVAASPGELFETILHELCHALVAEMCMYAEQGASDDHKTKHEERVVTGIAYGFLNIIRAGLSGELKKRVGKWADKND